VNPPVADLLGGRPLQLNPGVAHPPFSWSVGLPSDWALLDTHPQTWRRSAERLLDDRFGGARLARPERRGVLDFLEQLVADCQRAGTALSVVQLGKLTSGGVGSAGLHLAWHDCAPRSADLAQARRALPDRGTATEFQAATGPAVLHVDRMSMMPPGTATRVALASYQVFVPLFPTSWMAVLSTASAHPELSASLRALVVDVATTLQPADGAAAGAHESASARAGDGAAPDAAGESGTGRPAGFEKGFTTRLHRHEVAGRAATDG
jgi:hypothetical protein